MGTLSFQSDPILPQGYFKVDGVTAATLTTTGLSGVLYKPTTATSGQVLTYNGSTWVANSLLAPDFTASLSSNGYQKLPSGLIMQWGRIAAMVVNDTTWYTITFPVAFPTACLNIQATMDFTNYAIESGTWSPRCRNLTTTTFQLMVGYDTNSGTIDCFWTAIGY